LRDLLEWTTDISTRNFKVEKRNCKMEKALHGAFFYARPKHAEEQRPSEDDLAYSSPAAGLR
jgi:hypothetical protein